MDCFRCIGSKINSDEDAERRLEQASTTATINETSTVTSQPAARGDLGSALLQNSQAGPSTSSPLTSAEQEDPIQAVPANPDENEEGGDNKPTPCPNPSDRTEWPHYFRSSNYRCFTRFPIFDMSDVDSIDSYTDFNHPPEAENKAPPNPDRKDPYTGSNKNKASPNPDRKDPYIGSNKSKAPPKPDRRDPYIGSNKNRKRNYRNVPRPEEYETVTQDNVEAYANLPALYSEDEDEYSAGNDSRCTMQKPPELDGNSGEAHWPRLGHRSAGESENCSSLGPTLVELDELMSEPATSLSLAAGQKSPKLSIDGKGLLVGHNSVCGCPPNMDGNQEKDLINPTSIAAIEGPQLSFEHQVCNVYRLEKAQRKMKKNQRKEEEREKRKLRRHLKRLRVRSIWSRLACCVPSELSYS